MSDETETEHALDRRNLMRTAGRAAGILGVTVVSATVLPSSARAADGDPVRLGRENVSNRTTALAAGGSGGAATPTLSLANNGGPSLALQPRRGPDLPLGTGEITNTDAGPSIGVDYGDGPVTTFLATGADLTNTFPVPPVRALDLRTALGRSSVVNRSSAAALDSRGQLTSNQYIDVALVPDEVALVGVFLNVTAYRPRGEGHLEVYTPGTQPGIPCIHFTTNVTLSNSILVAPAAIRGQWVVRVFTIRTTHVALDIVGVTIGFPPEGASEAATDVRTTVQGSRRAQQSDNVIRAIRRR